MKDKDGFTLYIVSTNNPNREVTQLLVQAGAKAVSVMDLVKPEGCGINNSIYYNAIKSRPPLSEQEIISVARKYGQVFLIKTTKVWKVFNAFNTGSNVQRPIGTF